eukprot:16440302-Heterocapsa_arctica.AAC.1
MVGAPTHGGDHLHDFPSAGRDPWHARPIAGRPERLNGSRLDIHGQRCSVVVDGEVYRRVVLPYHVLEELDAPRDDEVALADLVDCFGRGAPRSGIGDHHAGPDHVVIFLRGEGEVDGGRDIAAGDGW